MTRPTAIITGAANGIGKSISIRLSADGFYVILVDRDEKEGLALQKKIGLKLSAFYHADISDERSVAELFQKIRKANDGVDVLVNNAGIIRDRVIWKMEADDFDSVVNVNLRGTWLMCREASRMMREQLKGRIINISSRAWLGNPGQTNYSASKAGIIGLTRSLALELGKYNVLVNAIAPGLIDTPLTQKLPDDVLQKLIEAQPTKSMGKPDDIAQVVAFLAHEKTSFITGQTIYVDGGKSIGSNL
jgi:NAD(P)-dependent dehydrogenase (short-subunit alcohol dehydrogenase family)